MRKLLKASICLLALSAAPAANAQDVVDPIGSLLDQIDEETAETRGVPPEAAVQTPASPSPASQPPPAARYRAIHAAMRSCSSATSAVSEASCVRRAFGSK